MEQQKKLFDQSFYIELEEEQEELVTDWKEPFDPKAIDIAVEQKSLDSLVSRIKHDEIDLNTDFQREGNLWSTATMSRLIESLLVRFPLPAFYFDASNDDKWLVVDGLQRLYTFKRFVLDCQTEGRKDEALRLTGLEFLTDFEGKTFTELPHVMQRRFNEAQITAYLIKPGTPEDVRYSIFYRINTGGLLLNHQEIRHALNQEGLAVSYLNDIAATDIFRTLINVSPKRMLDRELVLRHLAFRLCPYEEYRPTMKRFLNNAMRELKLLPEGKMDTLKNQFLKALITSKTLFGKNAFSKIVEEPSQRLTLNRGLFEVVTVLLAELTDKKTKRLLAKKEKVYADFKTLLKDPDFDKCITSATAGKNSVLERFTRMKALLAKYI
ncbi:MAG: DUF262 domain-containing protein [bacterium]|nr:DUF262 domain-containing protein [bacterium]